jgi:mono/diheme cytochrome c family protein
MLKTTDAQRNLRLRKLLFALLLALICIAIMIAVYQSKQWNIPEEAKRRVNPIQSSRTALASARAIYLDKCAQCHGASGKGDGPDAATYYPSPTNLTDANHINNLTDGEIFYQISQGRKPMPAFKKRLTEEQRWQLVLLVRSFAARESSDH